MRLLPLIGSVAIATIIPSFATAQNVTVDALSSYLTVGQEVTVTEINGNRSQGRITDLTGSTIVLRLDSDEQRSLSASTVRRVDVPKISVAPLIGPRRHGLMMSVRF